VIRKLIGAVFFSFYVILNKYSPVDFYVLSK